MFSYFFWSITTAHYIFMYLSSLFLLILFSDCFKIYPDYPRNLSYCDLSCFRGTFNFMENIEVSDIISHNFQERAWPACISRVSCNHTFPHKVTVQNKNKNTKQKNKLFLFIFLCPLSTYNAYFYFHLIKYHTKKFMFGYLFQSSFPELKVSDVNK